MSFMLGMTAQHNESMSEWMISGRRGEKWKARVHEADSFSTAEIEVEGVSRRLQQRTAEWQHEHRKTKYETNHSLSELL